MQVELSEDAENARKKKSDKCASMSSFSDVVLLHIFQYLPAKELLASRVVCKQWYCVGRDEPLWKRRFYVDFKIDPSKNMAPGRTSWFEEYKRLYYNSPVVQNEVLVQHTDEVLHVSFSHDGKLFCTCSKDSRFLVWDSSYPASIKYENSRATCAWKYCQISAFNKSDTLLLVSGVYIPEDSTSSLLGEIAVFGVRDGLPLLAKVDASPYDIFGDWYDNNHFICGEVIAEAESPVHSFIYSNEIMEDVPYDNDDICLYHFVNQNGAAIRYIILTRNLCSLSLENKQLTDRYNAGVNISSCFRGINAFKKDSIFQNDVCEKLFICTVGSKTYIPHQIGFKIVWHSKLHKRVDESSSSSESSEDSDSTESEDINDYLDYVIDLSGHIIGMKVSPDHKYLFVNCRPWPTGFIITDPLIAPPMNEDIKIHVIDLCTLEEVKNTTFTSHKGYTPTDSCFFIFLDVNDVFVASGSEDNCGYLWDRHYGNCIAKLPHTEVVNAVAFNPSDPEMLVTVSDDYTVKVWRSRRKTKEIGLNIAAAQLDMDM